MGRDRTPPERRLIGLLSRIGIVGTPESAALPALLAATGPDSRGDQFFGPKRTAGGPPALLPFWAPLRDLGDARRLWTLSEELIGAARR